MRISVNILANNASAKPTCQAMAKGIANCGDQAVVRTEHEQDMRGFDACVLWGFVTECQNIVKACQAQHIPWVFMDMAYWSRREYFKVTVNARHPEGYILDFARPADRFKKHKLEIKPRRKSSSHDIVLLAGLSGKAAWSFGWKNEEWERQTIELLRKTTLREIVYRPKPSWNGAKPIAGSTFGKQGNLEDYLSRTHCVVAHHSNVAVDALLEGIPAITKLGAASAICNSDPKQVEHPHFPDDFIRQQFMYNLAYCQYSLAEMENGTCWGQLKEDKLVCK